MRQKKSRAQLSSEFLVVVAIILVISLVAMGLAGLIFPEDMEARISESKIYWSANAQPLKITDWDLKVVKQETPISVVQYNLTVAVYNPGTEMMILKKLNITPGSYSDVYYQDGTWAGPSNNLAVPVYPHQSVALVAERWETANVDVPAITYELGVKMDYATDLSTSEQVGKMPLLGRMGYQFSPNGSLGYCQRARVVCEEACCAPTEVCDRGECSSYIVTFNITNGTVVINNCSSIDPVALGAAITSGGYSLPVTVKVNISGSIVEPWGSFTTPVQSNVNDGNNPRTYAINNISAGSNISITARSWIKVDSRYDGSQNSHWRTLYTRDSRADPTWVKVLRNGDSVPDIQAFDNQTTIKDFLDSYIVDGKIALGRNQAIFLFELGTNDINSAAADFQDLVMLINMGSTGCT